MNLLYYGDNLEILRDHIKPDVVDLVYLDPPFKSDQDYNVLFRERNGSLAAAQIQAFDDTWRWDQAAAEAYEEVVSGGGDVAEAMRAFRTLLGTSDMMAYLAMMAPRLVELRRVLKPAGSIYLHCDPTASHYLKLMMDAVFGPEQFRNEIIWRRTGAHGPRRSFGPIHDTLLFYTKTDNYFFRLIKRPYMRGHVESRYTKDELGRYKFTSGGNVLTGAGKTKGESGKPWKGFDPSSKNRHWAVPGFLAEQMLPEFGELSLHEKLDALYDAGLIEVNEGAAWPTPVRYLKTDDGHPLQDMWAYQPYTDGTVYGTTKGIDADVAWLGPTDPERLGYQTQKPLGLLERIIRSSCPDNGIVLDPFCGCGTAIVAAHKLARQWIGIDITHVAINLIEYRLRDAFGDAVTKAYRIEGFPTSLPDARALAKSDPYGFQWWVVTRLGARGTEKKKGPDKGIDGRLYFFDDKSGKAKLIIVSVKAGTLLATHVRELRGVIEREKAAIGVLVSMEKPTKAMRAEAAAAGFYTSPWGTKHARVQLLTVAELLDGKGIDYPPTRGNVTFKKAARLKETEAEQLPL